MQFFLHAHGDFICPKEWRAPWEAPFYNRLYYIVSGKAEYESDVERFTLEQGHVYLFPQNVHYTVTHDPNAPLHTIYFHITSIPNTSVPIDCTPSAQEDRELFELISRNRSRYGHDALECLIAAFLTRTAEPQYMGRNDPCLNRVLAYIHSHCFSSAEELTTKYLSKIACYNECYLIRKFKAATGLSPKQYVTDLKLKKALPLFSQMTPTEVCRQIGFGDYNNFRKQFKQKYGVNPSQYISLCTADI